MTRKEFLTELDRRLSTLSKEEADRHLVYYAEILADRMEDGMTEEEAVGSLESLDTIAARILSSQYTTPKKPANSRRTVVAVAATVILVLSLIVTGSIVLVHNTFNNVTSGGATAVDTAPVIEIEGSGDYTPVTIPAGDIRNIDITWISESVSFMVWEENEILLETFSSESPLMYEVTDDTLTIEHKDNFISGSSSLYITLPRTLAERALNELTIHVTSAYVDLFEINAETLNLTTISGICNVDGLFDSVNVVTTSADVYFSGSFRDGNFEAVSGCLTVTADTAPRFLQVDSVSGDVFLSLPDDAGYHVEFDSVSGTLYGDNYVSGRDPAEIRVDTISGDLSISNY